MVKRTQKKQFFFWWKTKNDIVKHYIKNTQRAAMVGVCCFRYWSLSFKAYEAPKQCIVVYNVVRQDLTTLGSYHNNNQFILRLYNFQVNSRMTLLICNLPGMWASTFDWPSRQGQLLCRKTCFFFARALSVRTPIAMDCSLERNEEATFFDAPLISVWTRPKDLCFIRCIWIKERPFQHVATLRFDKLCDI